MGIEADAERVARELLDALAKHDAAAFRPLFTDDYDDHALMLEERLGKRGPPRVGLHSIRDATDFILGTSARRGPEGDPGATIHAYTARLMLRRFDNAAPR